jgi:hypothetical protein
VWVDAGLVWLEQSSLKGFQSIVDRIGFRLSRLGAGLISSCLTRYSQMLPTFPSQYLVSRAMYVRTRTTRRSEEYPPF